MLIMQMGCHVQTFVSLSEYTYEHFCKRMEMDQSGFPAQVEGYFFFSFYTLGAKSNLGPKFVQSFQTFFFLVWRPNFLNAV